MSMLNKITPGPWRIVPTPILSNEWIESKAANRPNGDIICLAPHAEAIDSVYHWRENKKAIIAIPEMLSIIERLSKTEHSEPEYIYALISESQKLLNELNK
jgi:hypothetical protein